MIILGVTPDTLVSFISEIGITKQNNLIILYTDALLHSEQKIKRKLLEYFNMVGVENINETIPVFVPPRKRQSSKKVVGVQNYVDHIVSVQVNCPLLCSCMLKILKTTLYLSLAKVQGIIKPGRLTI